MFNTFKKVLNNQNLEPEDISKVSDYVFCRWLTGNPGTLQIAQMFNLYANIPLDLKLKVAQKIINGRIRYIPYPKGTKNDVTDLELLSEYFNISIEKAKLYMEFISDDDLNYIRNCIESKYKGTNI